MSLDPYPLEPDEPPPPPPPPAVVGEGFVCRRCGYDLRGLAADGRCPECAASVMRSLRGNVLEIADPGYLRRLGLGALMVELGVVAICAVPIVGVGFFTLVAFVPVIAPLEQLLLPLAGLTAVGAGVLELLGWFMLTARDPAHLGVDESDRARLTARIATLLCSVCWAFGAVVSTMPTVAAVAPGRFAILLRVAGVALLIGAIVQAVAAMHYLKYLAERVPDTRLAADIRTARNVATVAAVSMVLAALLSAGRATGCLAAVAGVIALMLTLIFFVKHADTVDRMRRHLSRMGRAGDAIAEAVAAAKEREAHRGRGGTGL